LNWFRQLFSGLLKKDTDSAQIGQNRGTGEFIDNMDWWFWNGRALPGLLSREQFERLRGLALTEQENRELARLELPRITGITADYRDMIFIDLTRELP
jgi:hypothetical protein